jgi:hypothetical protein
MRKLALPDDLITASAEIALITTAIISWACIKPEAMDQDFNNPLIANLKVKSESTTTEEVVA